MLPFLRRGRDWRLSTVGVWPGGRSVLPGTALWQGPALPKGASPQEARLLQQRAQRGEWHAHCCLPSLPGERAAEGYHQDSSIPLHHAVTLNINNT